MSVQTHPSGWRVSVYFGKLGQLLPAPNTGRDRLTRVVTKDEGHQAAKKLDRQWEDLKDELRNGKQSSGLTIGQWSEQFVELPRQATSRETYRYAIKGFVAKHKDTPIANWTVQLARVDAASRPPSQVKYIKTMFGAAVDRGVIDSNPYRDIKTPRKDVTQAKASFHEVWPIDPQEQIKLLDKILDTASSVGGEAKGAELRGKLAFAAWTGARPGEIRGLHRDDYHATDGFAFLCRVIDSMGAERPGTKNSLHRKIYVPPQAVEEVKLMPVYINQPYVFTNAGQPWKDVTFYAWWVRIRERANLGRMRFYDLRHFCATQLLEMGNSPEDVAAQLGHTDGGALVRDVYGHPSHDRALERIRHTVAAHTPADSSQVRHIKFQEGA